MKNETIKNLIALTFTVGLMPALLALFVVDSTNTERLVPKHSVTQLLALNGGAK